MTELETQEPDIDDLRIPPPDPGIYENIPFGQYLSWDALSQSACKPLDRSPLHYQAWLRIQENTPALRVGSITDTLVFEPGLFEENYCVRPRTYTNDKGEVKPWRANAKVCMAWMDDAEMLGKIIITPGEYDEAARMAKSVRAHPAAADALSSGQAQLSMVWIDKDTGVVCKGRLDWLCSLGIFDLKTTKEGGPLPHQYSREMNTYGYHIQAAFYVDGYEACTGRAVHFHHIVAEKKGPRAVAVYRIEPPSIEAGRGIYKRALHTYKGCCERNEWPGYSHFIEPINIPTYALRDELGDEGDTDDF